MKTLDSYINSGPVTTFAGLRVLSAGFACIRSYFTTRYLRDTTQHLRAFPEFLPKIAAKVFKLYCPNWKGIYFSTSTLLQRFILHQIAAFTRRMRKRSDVFGDNYLEFFYGIDGNVVVCSDCN